MIDLDDYKKLEDNLIDLDDYKKLEDEEKYEEKYKEYEELLPEYGESLHFKSLKNLYKAYPKNERSRPDFYNAYYNLIKKNIIMKKIILILVI